MRAAQMKERPGFSLMKQTDVQTIYHMQMPRWLFSDPRYADMSLDAQVTYTFLLNRFQLSRRNGWVNDFGEVFVIFPRKELARELRICEQRVTAAFKKLVELKLVWEKRCGRGDANQIYLASVEPENNPSYSSAPFVPEPDCDSRTAESEGLGDTNLPMPEQEPQDLSGKNLQNCASRTEETEAAEPQKQRPSYIKTSHTESSYTDVSQPVSASGAGGQTDDEKELMGILDACELSCFSPEVARVFENAIERLFYLDHFRVGGATLPRSRVRAKLDREVKNSTAYTMVTIFNCISESESDLMMDPELNRMSAPTGRW